MRRIPALLFLVVTLPALAGTEEAGELYRAGKTLLDAGDLDAAAAKFEAALREDPAFFLAHHGLGGVFAAKRDYVAAARRFREAIRLKADFPEAHNSLGVVLSALGEPIEAAAAFEKALALRPDYTNARLNLAGTQLSAGRPDLAEKSAKEALARDAKSAEARYLLARIAAGRKDHEAALRWLDDALSVAPGDAACHAARGEMLLALKRVTDAAAALRRATELDGSNGQTWFRFGVVCVKLEEWADAVTAFSKAEDLLTPKSAAAAGNLGIALLARWRETKDRGTLRAAIGALSRSLERKPAQADLAAKLAEAQQELASLPPE